MPPRKGLDGAESFDTICKDYSGALSIYIHRPVRATRPISLLCFPLPDPRNPHSLVEWPTCAEGLCLDFLLSLDLDLPLALASHSRFLGRTRMLPTREGKSDPSPTRSKHETDPGMPKARARTGARSNNSMSQPMLRPFFPPRVYWDRQQASSVCHRMPARPPLPEMLRQPRSPSADFRAFFNA